MRNFRGLVTVYQATLAGAYTGATTYNVGPALKSMQCIGSADFNGDGAADLAIPYSGATTQGAPQGAVGILYQQRGWHIQSGGRRIRGDCSYRYRRPGFESR